MKTEDNIDRRLSAHDEPSLLVENTEEYAVTGNPDPPTAVDNSDIPESSGIMSGGVAAILALAVIVVGALLFFAARGGQSENYNRPLAINSGMQKLTSYPPQNQVILVSNLDDINTDGYATGSIAAAANATRSASASSTDRQPVIIYLFPTNGDNVTDTEALNQLASSLVNSGRDVTIVAYTDESGNPSYNQRLSDRRAKSVGDYLISHGVSKNHIKTKGAGPTHEFASDAADRCAVITVI